MNPRLRIPARLTLISAVLSLAACAAVSSYSEDAPATGWDMMGIWALNPALSTDTQKALEALKPKPRKRGPGGDRGGPCGPGPGGPGGEAAPNSAPAGNSAPTANSAPSAGAGAGPGPGPCLAGGPGDPEDGGFDPGGMDPNGGDGSPDPGGGGPGGGGPGGGGGRGGGGGGYGGGGMGMGMGSSGRGPVWHPPLDIQTAALAAGDWLQLTHRDDELVIANANGSRSYTPGQHSVVSVETGVADQSSGWKGRGYTIEIKPQIGPRSVEHYELSPDGRQLIVHIEFDAEGPNKALKVVRVYDRTSTIPQHGPPAKP